jgi:hypothetical protein
MRHKSALGPFLTARNASVLGVGSPLIRKKTATLVGLEEPRTYIGCRFADNVGSRFLHRFGGKNAYDLECGRPDPFFFINFFIMIE